MKLVTAFAAGMAVLVMHSAAGADTGSFTAPYARASTDGTCVAVFGECDRGGSADAQTGALAARASMLTDASGAAIGYGFETVSIGLDHQLHAPAQTVRYTARVEVGFASAYASSIVGSTANDMGLPGFVARFANAQVTLVAAHEQGNLLTGECAAVAQEVVVDSEGILAPASQTQAVVDVEVELTKCPPGLIEIEMQMNAIAYMADHGVARAEVRDATLTRIDYSTS